MLQKAIVVSRKYITELIMYTKPGTKPLIAAAIRKGWTQKALAIRWGVGERQLRNIADDPKTKDWDAINGLPVRSNNGNS